MSAPTDRTPREQKGLGVGKPARLNFLGQTF